MQALGKHVVLKKAEQSETYKDSVIVRVGMEFSNEAKVVSVGDEVKLKLTVGDTVVFNGGRGTKIEGVEYIICKEEEILARIASGPTRDPLNSLKEQRSVDVFGER